MTIRLAAFLRAVNLGPHKRIGMAPLRELLTGLGFEDVRTVLQSGNAVFSCREKAAAAAGDRIEAAIESEFGFACRVVVRTGPELAEAIAADPLVEVAANPSRHFVGFLSEEPAAKAAGALMAKAAGEERAEVVGRHLYMWLPDGLSTSTFARVNFDRDLGVVVTNRNWNTVAKVAVLLGGG
jgi:uncharacterized protein (DUF1697 family)